MTQHLQLAFVKSYAKILLLARRRLAKERLPISTVSLVHETYLELIHRPGLEFLSERHLLGYVSQAMRTRLINHARGRNTHKRAADLLPLTTGLEVPDNGMTLAQIASVDQAFDKLGQFDPRLLEIATLRVMLGMEILDIAEALDISAPTVKRAWRRAKPFLLEAMDVH